MTTTDATAEDTADATPDPTPDLAPAVNRLRPDESQRVFRAVLDAMSRPGTAGRLDGPLDVPPEVLPILALADLSTGVWVDDPDWAAAVAATTDAPLVEPGRARLATAVHELAPDRLLEFGRGRADEPEAGALVVLAVPDQPGRRTWVLRGPGVDGERRLAPDLPDGLVAARAEAVAGFPAGVDLLLVAPSGWVVGLPRTTEIDELSEGVS